MPTDKTLRDNDAPEGQIWVCAACGKKNKNRYNVGDVSCFLNAVLCYDGLLDENGLYRPVEERSQEGGRGE